MGLCERHCTLDVHIRRIVGGACERHCTLDVHIIIRRVVGGLVRGTAL